LQVQKKQPVMTKDALTARLFHNATIASTIYFI